MRNLKLFLTLLFVPTVMLMASCDDDDDNLAGSADSSSYWNPSIIVSYAEYPDSLIESGDIIAFESAEKSDTTIAIIASHEWSATASDDWIKVSPSGSVKDTTVVTITTSKNETTDDRSGTVLIACGSERITINISQNGDYEDGITCFLDGYKLVWNDEFDSGSKLSSDWTHEVWAPYTVNNEQQYYVDGEYNGERVTELVDGQLNIHCFKSGGKIYSGRVYAKVNTGWTYGYIEARIQLPKGKGTWPAWWMMPVEGGTWPGCGEIDIMEEVGVDANWVVSTIHCNKYNNGGSPTESAKKYVSDAESAFHNYGVEWTSDYLRFYVDKELLLEYKNDGSGSDAYPFTKAFYPILNIAWGGDWGGYAGTDESALPVTMKVEYVRVFQK